MKKTLLFVCFLMVSITVFGQYNRRRGGSTLRTNKLGPTQNQPRSEKEKKEREKEYIATFITTLEADDFQKEIIKQTINDYFKKKVELYKLPFASITERNDVVKKFNIAHFAELKTMISETDMSRINDMITGGFKESDAKKKKRKKKKKKKRN